jgi:hypothetical protein
MSRRRQPGRQHRGRRRGSGPADLIELARSWVEGLGKSELHETGLTEEETLDVFFAWRNIGLLRVVFREEDRSYCISGPHLPPLAPPNRIYRRGRRAQIEEQESIALESVVAGETQEPTQWIIPPADDGDGDLQ